MKTARHLRTGDRLQRNAVPHRAERRADRRAAARSKATPLGQRILQLESLRHTTSPASRSTSGSPKQLGEIFDKLGMPVVRRPPPARAAPTKRCWKTGRGLPLPAKLLEHRSLSKLKSTYTDKLQPAGRPAHRPRAHPLRPGRGRHRAPVQQRPEPAEHPRAHGRGPAHPRGLHRPPGCVIASCDYSQIELRIMAHISGDEAPLRAFHDGLTCTAPPHPKCSAWPSIR